MVICHRVCLKGQEVLEDFLISVKYQRNSKQNRAIVLITPVMETWPLRCCAANMKKLTFLLNHCCV